MFFTCILNAFENKCRFKGLKNFKNSQKFKRDTRTGWLGLLSVHAN